MPHSRHNIFYKTAAVFLCIALMGMTILLSGCGPAAPAANPASPEPSLQQSAPPATPATPPPTPTPDPNDQYFTKSGEKTDTDDSTYWSYKSPTLSVEIKRKYNEEMPLIYYVAHIRVRGDEKMMAGFGGGKPPGSAELPGAIARDYQAVYVQNGDYFADKRNPTGVVIRNGKTYRDNKQADTLAVMPDGTLKVYYAGEVTADELQALGVQNSYSFGPGLIQNGVIRPNLSKCRLNKINPRSGIGMVEKGHYVAIVVEGRNKTSKGVDYEEYAKLFMDEGCTEAYNFDGGASSCMVFMGKAINKPTDRLLTKTFRRVPDVVLFGHSDLVK